MNPSEIHLPSWTRRTPVDALSSRCLTFGRIAAIPSLALLMLVTVVHPGWAQNLSPPPKHATQTGADSSAKIRSLLQTQADCWNRGDLRGFMQTYWKSPELTFSGGGKTTRGWHATLERYQQVYPREEMGQLTFDHLEITFPADSVALVLGQWHLRDDEMERDGNFTLVLKVFPDGWKIIHDHSSTREPETDE